MNNVFERKPAAESPYIDNGLVCGGLGWIGLGISVFLVAAVANAEPGGALVALLFLQWPILLLAIFASVLGLFWALIFSGIGPYLNKFVGAFVGASVTFAVFAIAFGLDYQDLYGLRIFAESGRLMEGAIWPTIPASIFILAGTIAGYRLSSIKNSDIPILDRANILGFLASLFLLLLCFWLRNLWEHPFANMLDDDAFIFLMVVTVLVWPVTLMAIVINGGLLILFLRYLSNRLSERFSIQFVLDRKAHIVRERGDPFWLIKQGRKA